MMKFHEAAKPFLSLLTKLGAEFVPHTDRPLTSHLACVGRLLYSWQNVQSVWVAGLFHSVYGTSSFQHHTASLEHRDSIRVIIGDEAEYLVYAYCSLDRAQFLMNCALGKPVHFEGFLMHPTHRRQLLEILVADRVEQLPHRPTVPDNDWHRLHLSGAGKKLFAAVASELTPGALEALDIREGES